MGSNVWLANSRQLVAVSVFALLGAACSGDDSSPRSSTTPGVPAATPPLPAALSATFSDWPNTDFTRTTVNLGEVSRGCPVRDCIPALDAQDAVTIPSARGGHARFAPATAVSYAPRLPVAVVTVGSVTKAYPLHILTWHEVVNDTFGDLPVVVSFCPLCNTAISFDRRVQGRTLDFGVSGNLRNSDLIMWDRQTESWWQQATGEGIAGANAGQRLRPLSTTVVSFADFARAHPDGLVLTEDTGLGREYGINPYEGYDGSSRPFLFSGKIDPRLPGLERVVALGRDGDGTAVAMSALAPLKVVNLTVEQVPIAVFWAAGTVSVLDAQSIENAKDIGSAAAYLAELDGRVLRFRPGPSGGTFIDEQTGSSWNILGIATAGELRGRQLASVLHTTEFWFAWAAFHPKTQLWTAPG